MVGFQSGKDRVSPLLVDNDYNNALYKFLS